MAASLALHRLEIREDEEEEQEKDEKKKGIAVTVISLLGSESDSKRGLITLPFCDVSDFYAKQLERPLFSDITVVVYGKDKTERQRLSMHRLVLASGSGLYRRWLEMRDEEKDTGDLIDESSSHATKTLLEACYTGKIYTSDNVETLAALFIETLRLQTTATVSYTLLECIHKRVTSSNKILLPAEWVALVNLIARPFPGCPFSQLRMLRIIVTNNFIQDCKVDIPLFFEPHHVSLLVNMSIYVIIYDNESVELVLNIVRYCTSKGVSLRRLRTFIRSLLWWMSMREIIRLSFDSNLYQIGISETEILGAILFQRQRLSHHTSYVVSPCGSFPPVFEEAKETKEKIEEKSTPPWPSFVSQTPQLPIHPYPWVRSFVLGTGTSHRSVSRSTDIPTCSSLDAEGSLWLHTVIRPDTSTIVRFRSTDPGGMESTLLGVSTNYSPQSESCLLHATARVIYWNGHPKTRYVDLLPPGLRGSTTDKKVAAVEMRVTSTSSSSSSVTCTSSLYSTSPVTTVDICVEFRHVEYSPSGELPWFVARTWTLPLSCPLFVAMSGAVGIPLHVDFL